MTQTSKFDLYESALSSLYEAPTDPRGWAQFMARFGSLIDACGGQYMLWDPVRRSVGFSVMTEQYPEKDVEHYNVNIAPSDARRQLVEQAPPGHWVYDHEHFDARFVDRSEAYKWLHACNIRYSAAVRLAEGNDMLSMIALLRAPTQAPIEAEEKRWLARVTPHIRRASMLHLRLDVLRTSAAAGWQAANALDYPILVVDDSARIGFANLAAEAMLRSPGSPLRAEHGLLKAGAASAHDRLVGAVRLATGAGPRRGSVLHVQRAIGAPQFQVVVLPATQATRFCAPSDRPMALITIGAPGKGRSVDAELLGQLFGLSEAEARVAVGLHEGKSLKQIADEGRVSIHTVRSQLQATFSKTGTHRQAELVTLVGTLPRLRRDA